MFASLTKYLEELRLYRRDEREQIVRERDNLQDAARCLVSGRSKMRIKPPRLVGPSRSRKYGRNDWMANRALPAGHRMPEGAGERPKNREL